MKKIIFYLAGLDNNGGAERVISNLSNYLSEKYHITIITTGFNKSRYKLNDKIICKSLDNNVDKSRKNRFIKNIFRIIRLNKLIKENNPNIIITFLPNEIFRILFLKKFTLKNPVIISLRDDPATEYKSTFRRKLMYHLVKYANGIVFQTKEAGDFFNEDIQKKSTIIPNPINEDFIGTPFQGERDKTIVSVGRLTPQKNHELLINSYSNISKKHEDYKLYIYGEGELRDDLKRKIKELNLEEKVFLKGVSNNIKEEIFKSSVFVLSSNHEGMPNALMEAMALGLPVISTNCPCGGPNFLIEDKVNGLLVEVGNQKEMECAIDHLLSKPDYANAIGEEANKICLRLDPETIYQKWEKFINKIIDINGEQ